MSKTSKTLFAIFWPCLKSLQWALFFNQFVRFMSCDGEFSTLRSTMELQTPHELLKRSVLKASETISKSQHRKFRSKSKRSWKSNIFDIWYMGNAQGKWLFDVDIISHWVIVYHRIAVMGNSTNSLLFLFTGKVNLTQILLTLSSLGTAINAVLVYYVWYTLFSMWLCILKMLRTANNANFYLF